MKRENVLQRVPDLLCCYCGACEGICMKEAIKIIISKGSLKRILDPEKCNNCGKCVLVCPSLDIFLKKWHKKIWNVDHNTNFWGPIIYSGYGWAVEKGIRKNGQSGGMVTAFLLFLLKFKYIDKVVVSRPLKNDPFKGEVIITDSVEDVIASQGSIYYPVPVGNVLDKINKSNFKVAVVGLPCHLFAIRKAEALNPNLSKKIVIKLGLFCAGVNNSGLHSYLCKRRKVKKKDIVKFKYRGHALRGFPGDCEFYLNSGIVKYLDRYERQRVRNVFLVNRCFYCWDKLSTFADISFGDIWGLGLTGTTLKATAFLCRSEYTNQLLNIAFTEKVIGMNYVAKEEIFKGQKTKQVIDDLNLNLQISKKFNVKTPDYMEFGVRKNKFNLLAGWRVITNVSVNTNFAKRIFKLNSWIPVFYSAIINKISRVLK